MAAKWKALRITRLALRKSKARGEDWSPSISIARRHNFGRSGHRTPFYWPEASSLLSCRVASLSPCATSRRVAPSCRRLECRWLPDFVRHADSETRVSPDVHSRLGGHSTVSGWLRWIWASRRKVGRTRLRYSNPSNSVADLHIRDRHISTTRVGDEKCSWPYDSPGDRFPVFTPVVA